MKARYIYRRPSNAPSPSLETLLMAEARELLTTREVTKDQANIERHLAVLDKKYKPGAEQLVRQYMHKVKADERSSN